LALRRSGTSDYRVRVRAMPGATTLTLFRTVSGTLQQLTAMSVPGLVVESGDELRLSFEVEGTNPTQLRAKVWKVGVAEPAEWQLTATDSTPALQAPGGVGLITYLSGSSTTVPAAARYDDLIVATPGGPTEAPDKPPVAAFDASIDGLDVALDGSDSFDPDGTIIGYAWDLGDGSTATGPMVTYSYAAPGTYQVTLEVTDDDGLTATAQRSITVTEPGSEVVLAVDEFDR